MVKGSPSQEEKEEEEEEEENIAGSMEQMHPAMTPGDI